MSTVFSCTTTSRIGWLVRKQLRNKRSTWGCGWLVSGHPGQVTISDPSREPMLDRAMPADAVPGSTIPEDTEAEIQLRDGTWIWAQVIGQRKDRNGRWCIGLRWYASPSVGGREGWYILDRRYIRRQNGPLLH
jgi:hypothetical protein